MFRTIAAVLALLVVPSVSLIAADRDAAADAAIAVGTSPYTRGAALPALYVSLAALQVADGYTTMHGMAHGAAEANPLMQGAGGNKAALWVVKGAATFSSIYVAERLWKSGHRGQAIAMMVVSNGVMAAVAVHNTSVLQGR